jgi:hypothetical protein
MPDAKKIHVGAGNIYVGVTAPATGSLPTGPTMLAHTAGIPATGVNVGHTFGGATFTYTPAKADIESDQSHGVVDTYVTGESCSLTFTIQERSAEALKLAFDAIGHIDDAAKTMFFAGGIYGVTSTCIALVSKRRNGLGAGLVPAAKYEVLVIYKAQSMDPVSMAYSRTEPGRVAVTIRGVHDDTRDDMDQLFQWYREKDATA